MIWEILAHLDKLRPLSMCEAGLMDNFFRANAGMKYKYWLKIRGLK
jgi:hypothetical protein